MNRKKYTKEFKLNAVRMLEAGEKPGTMLAFELGVPRNLLYRWQAQLKEKGQSHAFLGTGASHDKKTVKDNEITRLKAELARVKEERDILKKAKAFFTEDQQ